MGTGSFGNGRFNFVVVAPHVMGPSEKSQWVARFSEASRILYEATEGQLRFGRVFMADEGWGLGHAEFVVHDSPGTAYATHGEYGVLGRSCVVDETTGQLVVEIKRIQQGLPQGTPITVLFGYQFDTPTTLIFSAMVDADEQLPEISEDNNLPPGFYRLRVVQ